MPLPLAGLAMAAVGFFPNPIDMLRRTVSSFNTILPQYTEVVSVVVHMNRNGTKRDALYLAFSTAFSQLTKPGSSAPITASLNPGGSDVFSQGVSTLTAAIQTVSAIIPPANVYKVQYDAMDRWVQVTVSQTWGGIFDWVTGGVGGGWKSLTKPPDDGIIGGDWPQSAMVNQVLSGAAASLSLTPTSGIPSGGGGVSAGAEAVVSLGAIAKPVIASLTPLPDAGVRIATGFTGPGLVPPEIKQLNAEPKIPEGTMPKQPKIGTDLMRIIANSLGASCSSSQSIGMQQDLSASVTPDLKVQANAEKVNGYTKYPYQSATLFEPPISFPSPS